MKLLLLFTVSTLIVGSIDAAILSDTQHITNDLDRQIADLHRARDVKDGLNAAAEYFKAPQASKQNLKSRTKGSLDAAAAYFTAPDAGELRSNALILAQERLAAAAEYLKAPEFPKHLSRTAAEYFKAPETQRHKARIDRTAERLAAAAEYLKAPEFPKHLSRTKMENARAAAAEYFKAPEPPRHNTKIDRTAESLAATVEYFQAPESYPKVNFVKSNLAAVRKTIFRPTNKTPRQRFVRLG